MKNREIKFRVWNFENKIFEAPEDFALKGGGQLLSYYISDSYRESKYGTYIIQQFTGLTDKNGKEIYEGDYISFEVKGFAHGREKESYQNQEVYYDQELASFMFGKNYTKTGDYWGHCMLDEIDRGTIEAVGNIFEK